MDDVNATCSNKERACYKKGIPLQKPLYWRSTGPISSTEHVVHEEQRTKYSERVVVVVVGVYSNRSNPDISKQCRH